MRNYLRGTLAAAVFFFLLIASVSEEVALFVEMEVKGVSVDPSGPTPVVLLTDKEGKRAFPIWIGTQEAIAVEKELKKGSFPRPLTHDLLHSILTRLKVKVKEVRITELKNSTYYASLFLESGKEVIEVDARPSDSIILALKSKAPIFVSTRLLEEQGVAFDVKSAFGERNGLRVQELTPLLASQFGFRGNKGVLVADVKSGTPPETAGVKAGDIITKINSREIGSVAEFEDALDAAKKAGSVRISIFRDGRSLEVNLPVKP